MDIIIKPVLTEKMTIQGEKLNRYGFIVDVRAKQAADSQCRRADVQRRRDGCEHRELHGQTQEPLHQGGSSGRPC